MGSIRVVGETASDLGALTLYNKTFCRICKSQDSAETSHEQGTTASLLGVVICGEDQKVDDGRWLEGR